MNLKEKTKYKRKKRNTCTTLHYTNGGENLALLSESPSQSGPLQGFIYAKEYSRRREEATRQKLTRGSLGWPQKIHKSCISRAIPGTQVPGFGERSRLASRTFQVSLDSGI